MKQLDKRSVWLFFISNFVGVVFSFFFAFLLVIGMTIGDNGSFDFSRFALWAVLILVVLGAIAFGWAKLTYHFYRYELTDLGFRKESGVIYKRYTTIPYARIQNVDINRGIVARLLGLSDLMIQTAGASATVGRYGVAGAGAEGRLVGVSKADAEILRDELVLRASKSSQGQGL